MQLIWEVTDKPQYQTSDRKVYAYNKEKLP